MKCISNKTGFHSLTISVLMLLMASLTVNGCGDKNDEKTSAANKRLPTVAVQTVRKEPISRLLELTGETVAVQSVAISATVEGPISFCPWREGDTVETAPDRPARLIEINRELYRAEVNAADAALEVARAKLADLKAGTRPEEIAKAQEAVRQLEESAAFAKADYDRTARLVESGSLPGESLEKCRVAHTAEQAKLAAARRHLEMLEAGYTKTAIAVQEAAVKEAQAKLDLATARLNESVIFAPFSGTITRVHVRVGDMAAVKAPLLEMADMSSLVIRLAVPEAHVTTVTKGTAARVSLDALPGKVFSAQVTRVYPELDRRMRTRTAELTLNDQAALVPGMFARVQLVLEAAEEAVTVPQEAVAHTSTGEQVVYVVADGRAAMRRVKIGIEQGGRIQVLSGLATGEEVAVTGHERLRDGVEVRVAQPSKGQSQAHPTSGPATTAKGGGAS